MVRCTIKLRNNDRAVYQAGQTMTGLIQLHLDEPKKVRGLYFVVYGAAECDWAEKKKKSSGRDENRQSIRKLVHYTGKTVYMNTKAYLMGSADGEEALEIARGMHNFKFSCQLPSELPASFEASHGHISYNIEAGLDIPWGFDKRFKMDFTVIRHDDLNDFPELNLQTESEEIKIFCTLFRKPEPLIMTVSLSHTGYVPGETIKVAINYINKSKVDVHSTRIDLQRIIRFKSQTPRLKLKIETERMVGTFAEGVERSSTREITKALVIPRVILASNERSCDVVQVSYELKVQAEVMGIHRNVELKVPIAIGSVPLVVQHSEKLTKSLHLEIEDYSSVVKPVLESPPPTFDEAIKMDSKSPSTSSRSKPLPSLFKWNVIIEKAPSVMQPSTSNT